MTTPATDLSTAAKDDDVYIYHSGNPIGFRRRVAKITKRHIAVSYISGLWYFNLQGRLLRRENNLRVTAQQRRTVSLGHTIAAPRIELRKRGWKPK